MNPLKVVSTKVPIKLVHLLKEDAASRDVTPSRRVNEILTAHFKRYAKHKPNGSKKK